MSFERRAFIRTASASLAFGIANGPTTLAQSSSNAKGELESGSGSLHLEARLTSGLLAFTARDFIDDRDRALVIEGKFDSLDLYCAMFSHAHDRTIFAILRADDHSTTLVLSDTDEHKIGRLLVWNDTEPPGIFRVDKDKFMDTEDLNQSILDSKKPVDLLGKRKNPGFTARELMDAFADNPALLAFMRGRRPGHAPAANDRLSFWGCRLLSLAPGSLFAPMWIAY